MRAQRLTQVALVLAFVLLLARLATAPLQHNFAQVMANNAFSSRFATSRSVELMQSALALHCSGIRDCDQEAMDSDVSIMKEARGIFIPDPTPMKIVSDSLRIPSDQFVPSGLPGSLQDVDSPGVLFGPGRLELNLFLVSEYGGCWEIAVKAKHDDPPPVNLEVWVDREKTGTLSYDRGDESWQVLSVSVPISPNLHILGIAFANDYQDKVAGADRNAYIEYVEITQLGDSFCENN